MKQLTKILLWIPTIPFLILFFGTLYLFELLQRLAFRIGYQAHKKVVDGMIWCLNRCLWTTGSYIKFNNLAGKLPKDRPIIIVSNHQSMFDIPAIGWILREHHPKYIAKKSLERGYPSVSFNIRNGGSVTIDRKDKRQSAQSIIKFCEYLNQTNRAGCIFAEGRRAKDGQMRPFKRLGLSMMLKKMPNAIILPVVLENFWKMERNNMLPMPFGVQYRCTVLPPIDRHSDHHQSLFADNNAIIDEVEKQIRAALKQPLPTPSEQ